ncbi:F-box/FBD/LRR-repeat protein At1g13570-like [Cornus florida]|uniref:F-box/FBD/LRR-repeat protein At1g13570-like n=1 Tax=Cornus florida TaxID=4283 RepID=UPI0028A0E53F|nr:F-box/FBD/LRR-repeat protein At1g13570-like [Cornus florida]XP_059635117.1 F-box/FBD/LRR-repeat protein At1g13570-like [Cornus florida]XP_059635118.1 F-box/FBD/LRR-repeat protein At1g13570-like [Cornus florida]XP_059635119.1 F-box/FBD/LRR-repeat protein At1g13570-like [Cornus florida]XP_059635120.1 F-box/FBD/LRR-repeat protein At1g13570-like [Cornus florida]XP_059635121.1 F-box/FBD/LRR-repeat protein At1g13570-like [Cornus florida]
MKQREPLELPCKMEMEVDKISNLPGHIVDKILSHMSLRDAVRTSILSSKWRYKWVTLPHLVFDNQGVCILSQDAMVIKNKLVNIVDHVLLLHTGPIQKFKLSHRDLQDVSDIDRWILYLSRLSVKEFILEIWRGHRYKLPSSVYSFRDLIHLEVFNCLLKPPSTFEGFRSLKNLDLQHVTMDQDVFEYLISNCPLLERLTLMNFDDFTHLKIRAPNLRFFDIGGVFEEINFMNTFSLAIISVALYKNVGNDKNLTRGNTSNLIKFFAHLPQIQRLEVQSYFLQYLADGRVPGRLRAPCIELNYLSVCINFNDKEEVLVALCLLRSSPNLLELEMLARPEKQTVKGTDASFWEEDSNNCPLNQLRLVKIACISGVRCEMDFINYLLANSPVLERMTVKPASNDGGWEMLKELLRFRRASVQAEIIYIDP